MTLYSEQVMRYFRESDWPKTLRADIVEYDSFLGLRFFRDNLNSFGKADQLHIANTAKEFLERVTKDGIPIRTEVVKGDGRNDQHG